MKQTDIGIAVVGAGRIGTLRARLAAKHPAVRFLAISDRDPERASALAQAAGASPGWSAGPLPSRKSVGEQRDCLGVNLR